jgi:hypothetical protein
MINWNITAQSANSSLFRNCAGQFHEFLFSDTANPSSTQAKKKNAAFILLCDVPAAKKAPRRGGGEYNLRSVGNNIGNENSTCSKSLQAPFCIL